MDRLNIPNYNWWSEALHGVARSGVAEKNFGDADAHAAGAVRRLAARLRHDREHVRRQQFVLDDGVQHRLQFRVRVRLVLGFVRMSLLVLVSASAPALALSV